MKQIWLEKYRPKVLNEVCGNQEHMITLKSLMSQGTIPNLILSGPPGVGKTSSVLCIVRQLLQTNFKEATLQLNASDERGIDVVRQQIKLFAQKKVTLPQGRTKIVVLDQADSLTQGAQHALRMIMSNYSETTRFVLSCNNSQKIIQAIQSRCIILRFAKLKDSEIDKNLKRIIINQNVKITQNALKTLFFIADGDMRIAINNIQACHYASQGNPITNEIVEHICDAPSIQQIKKILKLAESKQILESLRLMHQVYQQGYSVYDIVNIMQKLLISMQQQMKKEKLFQILKYVAELKLRLLQGLNCQIQIGQFLSKMAML